MKMTAGPYRTHTLGELRPEHAGTEVSLSGWVHRVRDHGGVIFADLRDREGMTQVVFNPETDSGAHRVADTVRDEWVVHVRGTVRERPADMVNANLATGGIEVVGHEIEVLSSSRPTPFKVEDDVQAGEAVRLSHRFLDLRRPKLRDVLVLRHRIVQEARRALEEWGFLELETPVLTRSTPEGARDYLVPSRVNPGKFFALPQSPQLFKQVLMISGFDRYYQVARCFRDEDLRADRQPEFTQIDVEMSFVDHEGVMEVTEDLIARIVAAAGKGSVERPFRRMPYDEAMARFGSDKPDLRFGLEIQEVTELAGKSDLKVFTSIVENGGYVGTLVVPGGASFTRGEIDALTNVAQSFGSKGLAWVKRTDTWTGTIAKFFPEELRAEMEPAIGLGEGDLALFVAGGRDTSLDILGRLRLHLGEKLKLIPEDVLSLAWITDFPLLAWDPADKRWAAMHHPFTAPRADDAELLATDPGRVRSNAYDLVLNGNEIAGGSVRIHSEEMQGKVFELLGIDEEAARAKFGFLLDALSFGAPPHAGIAFGLDRIVMLLAGASSIRDTIAFPKTQLAVCPLTHAPTEVVPEQLTELGIRLARKSAPQAEEPT